MKNTKDTYKSGEINYAKIIGITLLVNIATYIMAIFALTIILTSLSSPGYGLEVLLSFFYAILYGVWAIVVLFIISLIVYMKQKSEKNRLVLITQGLILGWVLILIIPFYLNVLME